MTINNVTLVGRLVRDPELKNTAQGIANVSFTLAVNRNYKNDQGQREADFINVVIWRKQAELLEQYGTKGALIGITGRIQTRNYENQQGQRVYVTEVVADNFQLLESRGAQQGGQQQQPQGNYNNNQSYGQQQNQRPQGNYQNNNYRNNQQRQNQPDPFRGSPMEISDDDLPF